MAKTNDEIYDSISSLHTKVEVLESYIIGNGTPGMIKRVAELESRTNKLWGALMLIGFVSPIIAGVLVKLLL